MSEPTPSPSPWKRIRQNIRLLGWLDGMLLTLSRLLERLPGGPLRIVRYHLIAQPTRHGLPFRPTDRPFSETGLCRPDSPAVAAFPRTEDVIARRFRRGHECLCSRVGGKFAGFLWLARAHYDEDEVRCRYRLLAPERSAWDYDVYVAPEFRAGRTFSRLWQQANAHLSAQGVDWSFSRISAFNADSLNSHARLGARRLGSITFLCLGRAQLTIARALPFPHAHLSLSDRSRPRLGLLPPRQRKALQPMAPLGQIPTPAVVVGLCAHGLGLVRDLARTGIPVICLEANAGLPGMRSRYGDIRLIPDINGPGLLDSLDDLAATFAAGIRPVLILTNDKMVRTVGEAIPRITRHYRLSWAASAERLLPLLNKDAIEARCAATGLNYPASRLVTTLDTLADTANGLGFPVIAKPVQPLSALKTLVAGSQAELASAHVRLRQCLPLLLQNYIPGGDGQVRFGALYLDHGRIVARFEGRKLHSRPMGHTTIALSEPNDAVHELTRRFFDGLALSGPVSLEIKHAPDGSAWVIEPTVGRTDFWAGLCSINGVNLALIEYRATLRHLTPPAAQTGSRVWINGERFPAALPWLARHAPRSLLKGIRGVYLDLQDPVPFLLSASRALSALPWRTHRKLRKILTN